jgi:hypothetical protein
MQRAAEGIVQFGNAARPIGGAGGLQAPRRYAKLPLPVYKIKKSDSAS